MAGLSCRSRHVFVDIWWAHLCSCLAGGVWKHLENDRRQGLSSLFIALLTGFTFNRRCSKLDNPTLSQA